MKYSEKIVNEVKVLAQRLSDKDIATELNKKALAGRTFFTLYDIIEIRKVHNIPSPWSRRPGELTLKEVMQKYKVSNDIVRHWIEQGVVKARRVAGCSVQRITVDSEKESELRKQISNVNDQSGNQIE